MTDYLIDQPTKNQKEKKQEYPQGQTLIIIFISQMATRSHKVGFILSMAIVTVILVSIPNIRFPSSPA